MTCNMRPSFKTAARGATFEPNFVFSHASCYLIERPGWKYLPNAPLSLQREPPDTDGSCQIVGSNVAEVQQIFIFLPDVTRRYTKMFWVKKL